MTYLTPEAQHRLDEYLTEVRSCLKGCRSVDPDEIEQDICAHIAAEFPPSFGPVSKLDLSSVLARLGRPEQWVPEEERSPLRRAAGHLCEAGAQGLRAGRFACDRLRFLPKAANRIGGVAFERVKHLPGQARRIGGAMLAHLPHLSARPGIAQQEVRESSTKTPEDWRLAYLAFGLLVVGILIPPLLIGLLPASFCAARAALTVARERGEPLGARRWLIYPPLVLVGVFVALILFLWPIAPAGGLAHEFWRANRIELITLLSFPRGAAEFFVYVYFIAGALATWLVILGSLLWAMPRLAVTVFRPFADGFGPRQARMLVFTGLGVLAICFSLAVRVTNSDAISIHSTPNERWNYATHVEMLDR